MKKLTILSQETHFDGHTDTLLVALAGGELVGSVLLRGQYRVSATVSRLYVDQAYRRQGIGSQLVRRCCAISASIGCESLGLLVNKEDASAVAFYRSLGFRFAYEYEDGQLVTTKDLI